MDSTEISFYQALLLSLALIHCIVAPFSKVEESFNVHATYDILFNFFIPDSSNISGIRNFDHLTFPGVVPRTFLGAFSLSSLLYPIIWLLDLLSVSRYSQKIVAYLLARLCLAGASWKGLVSISKSLKKLYGEKEQKWFTIICCCQFHLLFYMGRLLPNSFALCICNLAIKLWLEESNLSAIFLLTFVTAVFRCDIILLLGAVGLSMLVLQQISFAMAVFFGSLSLFSSLIVSLPIDSYFWGPVLEDKHEIFDGALTVNILGYDIIWPELQVFWFNAILGKSTSWGVSPFLWYFYSALPKSLLLAYPLSLFGFLRISEKAGMIDWQALKWLVVALTYVFLYSFLGHKETRFMFPVLPIFNVLAALAMTNVQSLCEQVSIPFVKRVCYLLYLALKTGLGCMFLLSLSYLHLSSFNYPGGTALYSLNSEILYGSVGQPFKEVKVHIGVYAAMTGATKFLMLTDSDLRHNGISVRYSKNEEEEVINNICRDSSFDVLFIEDVVYEEQKPLCSKAGMLITKEHVGNPKFNFSRGVIENGKPLYVLQKTKT